MSSFVQAAPKSECRGAVGNFEDEAGY